MFVWLLFAPLVASADDSALFAHVAVGGAASFGDALGDWRAHALYEPPTKLQVPLEGGAVVRLGPGWGRVALHTAPLLAGTWLYANEAGEPAESRMAWGGHVAGGVGLGPAEVGLAAGVSWPARITTRAVVSLPFGESPLRGELRVGADVGTAGRVEGAGAVLIAFQPRVLALGS